MKSVLLRAPVLSNSGYGVHARQIARWLFDIAPDNDLDITVELLNWGSTGWLTNVEAEDGLVGQVVQAVENVKKFYDVTIQLQLPNEWNPMLGAFNIGVTAGVEVDKCNPKWVDAVNNMNLVIVPSEFTKRTFLNSGNVVTPIQVIPESYINEVGTGVDVPLKALDEVQTNFNFLVFGQITGNSPENDRKNLPYTIKWLAECLQDRPDVGVVIKTNMIRNTKLDQVATRNILSQLIREVKKGPGPRFHLLHGHLSNEEVASLYKHPKIKAMISLTRGEGFGIPLLEAACSGLPIIATGWSAHTEYLNKGKYLKVDHKLGQIHPSRVDENIFMQDSQWAYAQEEDFKKKVLKFIDASTIPRQWASELKDKLLPLYSFDSISKQYSELLLPILTQE